MEKGIITKLYKKGYGFIRDENGEKVFFHAHDLRNVYFSQLKEGTLVYFNAALTEEGYAALQVERQTENKTNPGINPSARLRHFSDTNLKIVKALSNMFYISYGGKSFKMGIDSEYSYCLLKPTSFFSEQFNLHREIILVFSDYSTFEPRSLDATSKAATFHPDLRLDRICSVIVSKDPQIESKLKDLLKNNTEMQVIIPFSQSELLSLFDKKTGFYNLVIKRFRDYFYERDLFAFFAPLQKDLYFFGRQSYVQELVNKHFSNENSGVFGLRRSGKTSVLNAVHRTLDLIDRKWILIDGQTLSNMRWNSSLFYLIESLCDKYDIIPKNDKSAYTPEDSAVLFERDLLYCSDQLEGAPVLLLFDEIENITFDIALSEHWRVGEDYIYFWRAIRAFYQKYPQKISFIIAGTNPKAIETPLIQGYDNPLYNQLQSNKYLATFTVKDTAEMVNKLGGHMGIVFDDIVCAAMTQEMGGHPFLIRQFCSRINAFVLERNLTKPIMITKAIYDQVLPLFEKDNLDTYCGMILDVLKVNYPDEYKMLEAIALNDNQVLETQSSNPAITTHLVGYGLIERVGKIYGFKNEAVKKYILSINKYSKILKTDDEKWSEISERRNRIEPLLRQIVKLQLKSSYGEATAKQKVLNAMLPAKRTKYAALTYTELFDPKKSEVYFSLMTKIILDEWGIFSNVFSSKKPVFQSYATIINDLRSDCHASSVTDGEMQSFRGAMTWLEGEVKNAI